MAKFHGEQRKAAINNYAAATTAGRHTEAAKHHSDIAFHEDRERFHKSNA